MTASLWYQLFGTKITLLTCSFVQNDTAQRAPKPECRWSQSECCKMEYQASACRLPYLFLGRQMPLTTTPSPLDQ